MSLEIDVLRALLRLARRRATPPTMDELLVRVGGQPRDIRRALAALATADLVRRTPEGPRLSLMGLAVAVAAASAPRRLARVPVRAPLRRMRGRAA